MGESDYSEVVASAVLAMLQDHGGIMRRDRLASRLRLQIRLLDPLIDVLDGEGKVSVILGRKGGTISLRRPN